MAKVGRAEMAAAPTPGDALRANEHSALDQALAAVARRMHLQAAIDACARLLLPGLAVAAVAIGLQRSIGPSAARPAWLFAVALPVLGMLYGAVRRVSPLHVAQLLDHWLGTPDLLGSASAFIRLPAATLTPFMRACITDAERVAERADPASACPMRLPRSVPRAVPVALAVGALTFIHLPAQVSRTKTLIAKTHLLHHDDVSAFQEELAPLMLAQDADSATNDVARDLNTLLERLQEGTLERAAALQALRELTQRLDDGTLAKDDMALREAIHELGQTLARDTLAEPVAEALRASDAKQASGELKKLAEELRTGPHTAAALQKLAAALQHARSEQAGERRERTRTEQQRLLKQQREQQASDEQPERLLHKQQRELEQLERETDPLARAERQLDSLEREFDSAAHKLGARDPQQAAEHLDQAAQELAKAAQSQMSAERRQALKERVEQLREMISKQQQAQIGKNGAPEPSAAQDRQRLSLDRFVQAARGQAGESDAAGKQPGEAGRTKLLLPGKGPGSGPKLVMPSPEGSALLTQSGEETVVVGPQPGLSGKPQSGSEATSLGGKHIDTRVQGERREGPARSEVIREAGQHGFASRAYQRVHQEYERHAEAVLERDRIPGGYRFYVRRYFQLIRPREVQHE